MTAKMMKERGKDIYLRIAALRDYIQSTNSIVSLEISSGVPIV